ncbi:MAG: Asp-tRNA(Asn)/Glu-tRNA(Gln) amidotransferase subunit GatC [Elusimicrobiota bacterium]|nr:Asp-tRNA(Asn)/Glu-tRNA(Gln) amidotransferase subunit GatC [Elusimicrobiota bacterium]
MSVSEDDVKKIAKLARLRLSDAEVALYGGQLTKIIDSMAELAKADTAGVPPTTSVLGAVNVMRDDVPLPFADTEALLSNAPERDGPYFKVKKVIE